ncbi:hypothetical protein LINPERHAP1_LOCUS15449 [Linum perenne]
MNDGGSVCFSDEQLAAKMAAPVSQIIGHYIEGISLWTLNPGTRMLTQMDLLKFFISETENYPDHDQELQGVMARSLGEVGVVNESVYTRTAGRKEEVWSGFNRRTTGESEEGVDPP